MRVLSAAPLLGVLALAALAPGAMAKTPRGVQAPDGTYTYTGTATVTAGGSNCIATSPAMIVGDAVVLGHGYGMLMHITSSTNNAAVLMDIKGNTPLVEYNHTAHGTASFALSPQSKTYNATLSILAAKGASATVPFTAMIDFVTPPFIVGKTGSCEISLALKFSPGVSKPLLKLLQGVL